MTGAGSRADPRILIIGAGHAGGSVAVLLRQQGHTGAIVLAGEETVVPYQRPPLSKTYLKGDTTLDLLKLRPDRFYAEHDIGLRIPARAVAIDRAAKRVQFDSGEAEPYDVLILATGSRNRALTIPGADLPHVHSLRSAADAERLRLSMHPGGHLVIIGGGYIGLEVAASATAFGMKVTVIEREARVLARVASEPLSAFFTRYHRDHGVDIVTDAAVASVDAGGVHLADGRRFPCELVLVGVGAVPCDALAQAAGLDCAGGVLVDLEARTSDPAILAIGDVTMRPLPLYENRRARLESVPNALEQAKQAVAAILGLPPPKPEVPWFWSDQFGAKLQIAGLPFDVDDVVVRGDPSAPGFAVFHLKGDVVRAVEAINSAPEFMIGKQLIGKQTRISRDRLADRHYSIKQVAA